MAWGGEGEGDTKKKKKSFPFLPFGGTYISRRCLCLLRCMFLGSSHSEVFFLTSLTSINILILLRSDGIVILVFCFSFCKKKKKKKRANNNNSRWDNGGEKKKKKKTNYPPLSLSLHINNLM